MLATIRLCTNRNCSIATQSVRCFSKWKAPKKTPPYTYIEPKNAEHASEALPLPWTWPEADKKRLLGLPFPCGGVFILEFAGTHWSHDIGSHFYASALIHALKCAGLFADYSRLLLDPNRDLSSDTLFRAQADGLPVEINQNLSEDEKKRRIRELYTPYHKKLADIVHKKKIETVFSIHSFTPLYEGQQRKVEIGVLFQEEEELAKKFQQRFIAAGFDARLNEPWSGKEGYMFAAHSTKKRAIMFEFRNDLLRSKEFCQKTLMALLDVVRKENLHLRTRTIVATV